MVYLFAFWEERGGVNIKEESRSQDPSDCSDYIVLSGGASIREHFFFRICKDEPAVEAATYVSDFHPR